MLSNIHLNSSPEVCLVTAAFCWGAKLLILFLIIDYAHYFQEEYEFLICCMVDHLRKTNKSLPDDQEVIDQSISWQNENTYGNLWNQSFQSSLKLTFLKSELSMNRIFCALSSMYCCLRYKMLCWNLLLLYAIPFVNESVQSSLHILHQAPLNLVL